MGQDFAEPNPHAAVAPIRLLFLHPAAPPQQQLFELPPQSRWSATLADTPAAASGEVATFIRSIDNLPLLVERTMTWDGDAHAGTAEVALESTNLRWYFAEGAQNPMRTNLVIAARWRWRGRRRSARERPAARERPTGVRRPERIWQAFDRGARLRGSQQ